MYTFSGQSLSSWRRWRSSRCNSRLRCLPPRPLHQCWKRSARRRKTAPEGCTFQNEAYLSFSSSIFSCSVLAQFKHYGAGATNPETGGSCAEMLRENIDKNQNKRKEKIEPANRTPAFFESFQISAGLQPFRVFQAPFSGYFQNCGVVCLIFGIDVYSVISFEMRRVASRFIGCKYFHIIRRLF